jgi:amidophosphoribosyltransferase
MVIQTECGIFATLIKNRSKNENETIDSNIIYQGLRQLQHRGRDCYGITYINSENNLEKFCLEGVIDNNNNNNKLTIKSTSLVGHLRYATSGKKDKETILKGCQPFISTKWKYSIAHNGNIPSNVWNHIIKKYEIEDLNHTESDTKKLMILIDFLLESDNNDNNNDNNDNNDNNNKWKSILTRIINEIPYAYSLIIQTLEGDLWIIKDKYGVRPIVILELENIYYVASETVAFEGIDYQENNLYQVKPGEIVYLNKNKREHYQITNIDKKQCVFEYIYFMRGDSVVDNTIVNDFRKQLGQKIVKQLLDKPESESDLNFSIGKSWIDKKAIICGVPKSGIIYGESISDELGLEYQQFIKRRNNYGLRTFILENDEKRIASCKEKYEIDGNIIKNKVIIVVDDSIVRGNTIKYLIKYLRQHQPKEIHLISGCPPIKYPCHYGVDFPDIEELIANKIPIKELSNKLGVESLHYLDLNNLVEVSNNTIGSVCNSCFTGNYLEM